MPQLLPFYFVNMLSYSFLLFLVILYVLSTYLLPNYPLLFAIRMSLVNNTPRRVILFIILFGIYLFVILFGIYFFVRIEESEGLLSIFVPIMIYSNADTNKLQILKDNKGKTGIYIWTHLKSGKRYIGSAVNLSKRILHYYSIVYLARNKSMYIYNALLHHGYSNLV